MTLHRVARLLERLGGGEVLVQLAIGDAAQMLQMRDLGRVDRHIEERKRLVDAIEGGLAKRPGEIHLCEKAQQRRALALRRRALEARSDLGAHGVPIVTLGRGFRGETVEGEAFLGREGNVSEEVVEALAEAGGDDLEGADRWPHQARFDLRDEALRELLARQLRLAHAALAPGAPNAFS